MKSSIQTWLDDAHARGELIDHTDQPTEEQRAAVRAYAYTLSESEARRWLAENARSSRDPITGRTPAEQREWEARLEEERQDQEDWEWSTRKQYEED
jgi:hypothetical protein